ncbi:rhodanese-like domain-containing protein [Streptomyces sp. NPDC090021]|uniref:rhodanese-like domain-containing protein n=1 Tax=Streptomyces sp. NPDC090021 TaxID=3365919 RepID=UPI00380B667F
MTAPHALSPAQALPRLQDLIVLDVRTPGEYATGHLPGALNIPLDHLSRALPAIRHAAGHGDILVVCASGARSDTARTTLAEHGVDTATLTGGTGAWAAAGHDLHRPEQASRLPWGMERQVRLTAGTLVLAGLGLGPIHPALRLVSAAVAGGLAFSAVTDSCGMAAVLARLPHNRPRRADIDAALAALLDRQHRR